MTFQDFLVWLMSGLGSSMVISYFVERWAWFQTLEVDVKKIYKTAGASLVAIMAYLALEYVPADFWVALSPYWQLVLGVVSVNYGVEIFHWFDKKLVK